MPLAVGVLHARALADLSRAGIAPAPSPPPSARRATYPAPGVCGEASIARRGIELRGLDALEAGSGLGMLDDDARIPFGAGPQSRLVVHLAKVARFDRLRLDTV